jgi:arabinogalactan oligomer / maltooligosaccharide transport system permease protein
MTDIKPQKRPTDPMLYVWHAVLIGCLIAFLSPAFFVIVAALRKNGSLVSAEIIPSLSDLTFNNFSRLLAETPFLTWMKNTLIVSCVSTFIAVSVTTLAGYAFSRFRFKGRKNGLLFMILLQMFPAAMSMVAIFRLLQSLGPMTGGLVGLNSLFGLSLVYIGAGIPFNSWIIKGYVDALPIELEESAYLDGATPWQTFSQVVLPLMGPVLATVAVFNFIAPYSDFVFPSVLLFNEDQYTLAIGMQGFISGNFSANWSLFAASAVLGSLPILVVFFSLQKFLVQGLTAGAVKG